MKLKTVILAGTALAFAGSAAMAKDMTIVSWGGAYQASQKNAYADPYVAENSDINVIWDESSNEAVAKLRAMNEAGNITWDLVDVVAS
ncbi:MAG: ABC transporter substrate-binding protein, partial [Rhodospirillaceae bacterium]